MIGRIKTFLKNHSKLYALCRSIYYKKFYRKNMLRNMQKNGNVSIVKIQNILQDEGKFFFFDMGTLLGIIREGRLLSHDLDIDVAVYIENEEDIEKIRKKLISQNCRWRCSYYVNEIGCIEDSFLLNGIKFDICYYRREDDIDICYLLYRDYEVEHQIEEYKTVRLECSKIEQTKKVMFNNVEINVPDDAEKYLSERYGQNWRVPDKNYIYYKGPSTTPIKNMGKKFVIVNNKLENVSNENF